MALIKCPDCGKDVSTLAASCPNCGRPVEKEIEKEIVVKDTYRESENPKYCPICAIEFNPGNGDRIVEKDGISVREYKCKWCDSWIEPLPTKYDFQYYWDKWKELHRAPFQTILEEIAQNPLFDEEKRAMALKNRERDEDRNKRIKTYNKSQQEASTKPKCPTCGSTNIEKISTTTKVVGVAMLGLFSKTARSQFKCNSCGYKW